MGAAVALFRTPSPSAQERYPWPGRPHASGAARTEVASRCASTLQAGPRPRPARPWAALGELLVGARSVLWEFWMLRSETPAHLLGARQTPAPAGQRWWNGSGY